MITADTKTFLVRLLGTIDGIFVPSRNLSNRPTCALDELRASYIEGRGIPWVVGGGDERVGVKAVIDQAATDGLLTIRRGVLRRVAVGLTPRGHELAQFISASYMLSDPEPWSILTAMRDHLAAGECFDWLENRFVEETTLLGIKYDHAEEARKRQEEAGQRGREGGRGKKKPLASFDAKGLAPSQSTPRSRASHPGIHDAICDLELQTLPLLTSGLVWSNCAANGRTCYALSDRGRERLAAGKPERSGDLPRYTRSKLPDIHNQVLLGYLKTREGLRPNYDNSVHIPLSNGLGYAGSAPARTLLSQQLKKEHAHAEKVS